MLDNIKKNKWIIALVVFLLLVSIAVIVMGVNLHKQRAVDEELIQYIEQQEQLAEEPAEEQEPQVITEYIETEKIVEVEKEITQEMIQSGLNDMGVLVTEEYYFTQVEEFKKTRTVFKYITTESTFIYSYDGTVTAGINFEDVVIEKDDDSKTITVTLPPSEIQSVDIDYESFRLYSEKEGLWNPISVEDFNESMIEFEANAEQKAKEKGILDRADDGAEKIIDNFIRSLVDTDEYTINYVKQGGRQ